MVALQQGPFVGGVGQGVAIHCQLQRQEGVWQTGEEQRPGPGGPFSSGVQDQRVDVGALPAEPQVAPPSLFWFGGAPSDPGPVALIWSII